MQSNSLGFPPEQAAPATGVTCTAAAVEYLFLGDRLKQLRGSDFETNDHPAAVLDRATGPGVRVWGWWADAESPIPCLLWASERGWSATVVEPCALDSEGYERPFWAHRVNLLDLALANAIGPVPTLEQLELNVAADDSFGFGVLAQRLRSAVLWGILQQRAARMRGVRFGAGPACPEGTAITGCSVDEELTRLALVPTLVKRRWSIEPVPDTGVQALFRAVRRWQERSTVAGAIG
jgi:hypothetical protein